jgi:hypothetical protein
MGRVKTADLGCGRRQLHTGRNLLRDRTVSIVLRTGRGPPELLDDLIERDLLFEFNEGGTPRYRTRMAETVRLFSRLRQIRPWNTWQTAPTLVADFRFAVGPRLYPKRHLVSADAIPLVKSRAPITAIEEKTLAALLRDSRPGALSLSTFQMEATAPTGGSQGER